MSTEPASSPTVTPWFSINENPPEIGWYEYQGFMLDPGEMLYWNGWQWGYWINPVARRNWTQMAGMHSDKWRGQYVTNPDQPIPVLGM